MRSLASCCLLGELGCCNFEDLTGEYRSVPPGDLRLDCGDGLALVGLVLGLVGVRAIEGCLHFGSR